MKRLSITALAVAAVGFSGVGLANDPTPTSITSPDPGALIYGEMIELAGVVDASATLNNIFQNTGDVAWAVRQRGDLLADAGCNAPTGVAIVAGNVEGFEDYASLDAGIFSADVDATGLTAGLYCFALNFPGVGRAFVDFYIVDEYAKVSGGFRFGEYTNVSGNSPTHTFDGYVADAGAPVLLGAFHVNYRQLGVTCTFTPGATSYIQILDTINADHPAGVRAVVWNLDGSCSNGWTTSTARFFILEKGSVLGNRTDGVDGLLEAPRGAVVLRFYGLPSTNDLEIDATPGFTGVASWILLERGNGEVGVR
jgi:hypothetical protein